MMIKKIYSIPLYPFFVAIYPILAVLASNLGQVKFVAGIRPLFLSVAAASLLFLLLRLLYRNWHRAAFVTAGLVLLFYMYSHVYDLIFAKWKVNNFAAGMLAIWLLLAILVFLAAALPKVKFEAAALALNVISFGLLIYPTIQIIQVSFDATPRETKSALVPLQNLKAPSGQPLPDIYYIMPEDYGRADLLQKSFNIDVSQFMQDLKDMGFYVAECSQSNYVTSELSLGSSLNMDYLQDLDSSFTPDNIDQGPVWNAIRYNAAVLSLKQAGYKTVAFATGFAWSELDNADVYLSPSPLWSGLTNFEDLLLRTTPIRHLEDVGALGLDEIDGQRYRERTMLIFNSMEELAHMPGPKFVFVHIISPHEPFVFGPDGSPIDPLPFMNQDRLYTFDKYSLGYQDQIPFLNQMLEQSIKILIAESSTPPVIVLQTDTSPLFMQGSDRFKILNAYYMPGHTDQLYPSISPVNTFRVILNAYLGGNFPLLPDISYSSPIPHIYDFTQVQNPCTSQ